MFKDPVNIYMSGISHLPVPEIAKIFTENYLSKLERHGLILIYKNKIPGITKCLANFQSNSELYSPTHVN